MWVSQSQFVRESCASCGRADSLMCVRASLAWNACGDIEMKSVSTKQISMVDCIHGCKLEKIGLRRRCGCGSAVASNLSSREIASISLKALLLASGDDLHHSFRFLSSSPNFLREMSYGIWISFISPVIFDLLCPSLQSGALVKRGRGRLTLSYYHHFRRRFL